jgi:hypothetical protein
MAELQPSKLATGVRFPSPAPRSSVGRGRLSVRTGGPHPEDVPSPPAVAAVIPAHNEAPTVGAVVRAARAARLVDEVLVVDGGSADGTAAVAGTTGARVVPSPGPGKGEAMAAGVAATGAPVIVFLDADLIGLRPDHVDRLAQAVLDGRADMACGLFDRGPLLNPLFLHVLPVLTGERALRRELFEALHPRDVRGYRVEAALNALCRERGARVVAFVLDGMFHRTKERKYGSPVLGFLAKVGMLLVAVWAYACSRLRRLGRVIGPGRPQAAPRRASPA